MRTRLSALRLLLPLAKFFSWPILVVTTTSRMEIPPPKTLHYKRSHFVTQLPLDYLYSPSHCWMAEEGKGVWRVGLTKFASRMLGEMVDHAVETEVSTPVKPGQIIGWVEGFKAISDLYCVGEGAFAGTNLLLKEKINLINKDPYGAGWIYKLQGNPDARCGDVHFYRGLLDQTIDKILEKQVKET